MANVAETLKPSPCPEALWLPSHSFIDSALLKGDLLLTRHKGCSGAQLLPMGALSPHSPETREGQQGECFQGKCFGWAVRRTPPQ